MCVIKYLIFYIILFGAMLFPSCKKFISVDSPRDRLVSSAVFASDASANAAMVGIYSTVMNLNFGFASGGMTLYPGLSADEFTNYSPSAEQTQFYTNTLVTTNATNASLWSQAYSIIYAANSILDNLKRSSALTDSLRTALTGEAKFIRAFFHFYLVNLYGKVPLVLTTNYQQNTNAPGTDVAQVYRQIITDLLDAQQLLPEDYRAASGEKVRPNKWAATALLARAYLFIEDWTNAAVQSSLFLNSSQFQLCNDLNTVFMKNSSEAIWQLMPVISNSNTYEGRDFILTGQPATAVPGIALSPTLMDAFEPGDQRRTSWVDSIAVDGEIYYYPYKYKAGNTPVLSEYYTVLRLSEQYLIHAEAEIQLHDIAAGIADLNIIRARAGAGNLPDLSFGISTAEALVDVARERQIELFAEWGHRWLDTKRTHIADSLFSEKKTYWQTTDQLYPIPQTQIQKDPFIVQNPGY
jgi:hypothetical protein